MRPTGYCSTAQHSTAKRRLFVVSLLLLFSMGLSFCAPVWAGEVEILTATLNAGTPPDYTAGDTIVVSGDDALTRDGWNTLKGLNRSFDLILNWTWDIPDGALKGCNAITAISGDIWTAVGMEAFSGCVNLSSVSLSGVTEILLGAFAGCSSLTEIMLPASLETLEEGPFLFCTSLVSIDVVQGNNKFVVENGALFNTGKTELIAYPAARPATSFDVPDGVKELWAHAFRGAVNLTEITLPKSLDVIGFAVFGGCTKLVSIDVAPENTTFVAEDGVLYNKNKTELIAYPAGRSATSFDADTVATVCDAAFEGASNLKEISLPSVKEIRWRGFADCTSLETLTLPDLAPTLGNTWIFGGVPGPLAIITVPNGSASGYTVGNWLATLESIPGGVTINGVLCNPNTGGDDDGSTEMPSSNATPGEIIITANGESFKAEKQDNGKYLVILPAGTDPAQLKSLSVRAKLPAGATISPDLKGDVDFSQGPVTFTITAEDGTTKTTITIEVRIESDQPTDGSLITTDASQCLVYVVYNADGTVAFEIRLPIVSGFDLTTPERLYGYLTATLNNLVFAIVGPDGSIITMSTRDANAPYLRIKGTAATKSALESATLSGLSYWLKGDATEYKQTFAPPLKISDMKVTYTNDPPTDGGNETETETDSSSGGGCDAGFGVVVLLVGIAIMRKRGMLG